ncbi:hemolysin activator protein [Frateuria sp. Soil773]|uniref:ShlB/FhaC/HecB family hemolysin secretion/activation protein n=1 Tax=Frateuria sp. Soil773 TaxID=1736407 RepID=UPI0007003EE9|nr:ShlB/FhaC/HecB family hemolysin secretion/activation protein [Frateuria sp. Soil773]KRE88841.1 hemolysin activator protein [Frateuria sp. Soil773]
MRDGASAAPAAPVAAAPAVASAVPAQPESNVLPPVRERTDANAERTLAVRGFRVEGVAEHPRAGVTRAGIQALADAQWQKLGGTPGQPARLSFAQLQQVADGITEHYRKAGFIVATAYLPAQTVGDDRIVSIQVLEGRIGKIVVKGTKRYSPSVVAAPAERLKGKALQKDQVESALLYARDLPGLSVSSTFQPGEHTGETDLVMLAREEARPYKFSLGANNYGTEVTGRYRAQAGLAWNNPLGFGDSFAVNAEYAFDPSQSTFGSLNYRAPIAAVPGLAAVIGGGRSQLRINNGPFAALHVNGPSSQYYTGADWKFVNAVNLQLLGTLHYLEERSRLDSMGFSLSREKFRVAELGFGMRRTDTRLHGIDLLQASWRHSLSDDSRKPDLISPQHARSFSVFRLGYTRLQFLTQTQRLYFKLSGQYTRDALVPMEQFSIGGPDSVRAYPIADALLDRGYYGSLEYHVDAPGFGNKASPFYGRPWRELLELEAFVDFARGFPAGDNQGGSLKPVNYRGAGAGFIFRLPRFHQLELHLDAAKALNSPRASDGRGYHVYARFGLAF